MGLQAQTSGHVPAVPAVYYNDIINGCEPYGATSTTERR